MLLQAVGAARTYRAAGKYSKNRSTRIAMSKTAYPSKRQYAKNPALYRSRSGQNISGRQRLNRTQRATLTRKESAQYGVRRVQRQNKIIARTALGVSAIGLANQAYRMKYGQGLPGLRGPARSFKVKGKFKYMADNAPGARRIRFYGANFSRAKSGAHSYFQPRGFGGRINIRIPNRIAQGPRPKSTLRAIPRRTGGMRTTAVNMRRTFKVGRKSGRVRRNYKGQFAGWF